MSPDPETACPTCGGVGRDLALGVLVPCDDCEGVGRVPAVVVYDWYGALNEDHERWPPYLIPISREYREDADA